MDKLFLEVSEAGVAYEILLRGERNKIGALALATQVLRVVGGWELYKASKLVLAVKLEKRLKSRKARDVKGVSRLDDLNLGGLALENNLVLLVARAKSESVGQFCA